MRYWWWWWGWWWGCCLGSFPLNIISNTAKNFVISVLLSCIRLSLHLCTERLKDIMSLKMEQTDTLGLYDQMFGVRFYHLLVHRKFDTKTSHTIEWHNRRNDKNQHKTTTKLMSQDFTTCLHPCKRGSTRDLNWWLGGKKSCLKKYHFLKGTAFVRSRIRNGRHFFLTSAKLTKSYRSNLWYFP